MHTCFSNSDLGGLDLCKNSFIIDPSYLCHKYLEMIDRVICTFFFIFKIVIFGHETWPLAKVPEVTHILSFYPQGVEIA